MHKGMQDREAGLKARGREGVWCKDHVQGRQSRLHIVLAMLGCGWKATPQDREAHLPGKDTRHRGILREPDITCCFSGQETNPLASHPCSLHLYPFSPLSICSRLILSPRPQSLLFTRLFQEGPVLPEQKLDLTGKAHVLVVTEDRRSPQPWQGL